MTDTYVTDQTVVETSDYVTDATQAAQIAVLTDDRDYWQRLAQTRQEALNSERDMHDSLCQDLLDEAERQGWCSRYEEFVDEHPNARMLPRERDFYVYVDATVRVRLVKRGVDDEQASDDVESDDITELLGLRYYDSTRSLTDWTVAYAEES